MFIKSSLLSLRSGLIYQLAPTVFREAVSYYKLKKKLTRCIILPSPADFPVFGSSKWIIFSSDLSRITVVSFDRDMVRSVKSSGRSPKINIGLFIL